MRLAAGQEINFAGDGIEDHAMPLIKVKPTSPGRRALVKVVTPELHKGEPHWPLVGRRAEGSGRNNHGRVTMRHQGGGHKQHCAWSISAATRTASRPRSSGSSTTRTAARTSRCCSTPTASAATSSRRKASQAGAQLMSGSEAPIKAGQHAAAAQHPDRHHRALRRDAAGQGRAARALGGRRACRCWRAKARTRSCACARARSARCTSIAAPPSARRATRSTTSSRSARPGACAGAACGRPCAAWR